MPRCGPSFAHRHVGISAQPSPAPTWSSPSACWGRSSRARPLCPCGSVRSYPRSRRGGRRSLHQPSSPAGEAPPSDSRPASGSLPEAPSPSSWTSPPAAVPPWPTGQVLCVHYRSLGPFPRAAPSSPHFPSVSHLLDPKALPILFTFRQQSRL